MQCALRLVAGSEEHQGALARPHAYVLLRRQQHSAGVQGDEGDREQGGEGDRAVTGAGGGEGDRQQGVTEGPKGHGQC